MTDRTQFASPFASLLDNRKVALAVTWAAAAHGGLMWAGFGGWPCPLMGATGLPCPGCGLSRATAALLRGDWQTSLAFHAFAPVAVLALALLAGSALLPEAQRGRFIRKVEGFERSTRLSAVLLVGLVVYWLARLLFSSEAFIRLLRG